MPGSFVTGGAGFAGRHLVAALRERDDDPVAPARAELDLRDGEAVRAALRDARPERVFHLAALASVARSWEDPREALLGNLEMTVNLLEAVRTECAAATVLVASSGEVYGPPQRLPVTESDPVRPQSPYAVSKAACELVAGQQRDAHALRVITTRAFNHAGPGQSDTYVVGSLTRQVAEAERAGRGRVVLRTGNVDSARDFTDVRDVARAYAAAERADPGTYNVCSGRSRAVRELIDVLREAAEVEVDAEVDPRRMRSHDVPEVKGSAKALEDATGWRPEIPFEQTVADALDWWRERLSR